MMRLLLVATTFLVALLVQQVTFTTDDGVRLHGWFVPAKKSPTRATLFVFNGNAGHRAYRAALAHAFRPHGVALLLFDYRGYGDNAGSPDERGLAFGAGAARLVDDRRRRSSKRIPGWLPLVR